MASDDAFLSLFPRPANMDELGRLNLMIDHYQNGSFLSGSGNIACGLEGDIDAGAGDDDPVPGQTPQSCPDYSESDWRDGKHLELPWKHPRKCRAGFYVGSSAKLCDIVIPDSLSFFRGVSAVQGLFTFDEEYRLIYRDIRDPDVRGEGSAVVFNGLGAEKRRGFTWVLSGTDFLDNEVTEIELQLHNRLRFRLFVPQFDRQSKAFRDKVDAFRTCYNNTASLADDLGFLNADAAITAAPSGVQTLARGPLLIDSAVVLGQGGYGVVKRLYDVGGGWYIARKTPPVGRLPLSGHRRTLWEHEIQILKRIQDACGESERARDSSRHVVQMIGCAMLPSPYIDMEFVPCGSLRSQHHQQRLSEVEVLSVLQQVMKALTFLHGTELAMAHRDIKPDNILVLHRDPWKSNIHVKLADFGFAKDEDLTTTLIGTRLYMAPELFSTALQWGGPNGRPQYTNAVDIWAVGVMVYSLVHDLPTTVWELVENRGGPGDLYGIDAGLQMCQGILNAMERTASPGSIASSVTAQFAAQHMVRWEAGERLSASSCLERISEVLAIVYSSDELALTPVLDAWAAAGDSSSLQKTVRRLISVETLKGPASPVVLASPASPVGQHSLHVQEYQGGAVRNSLSPSPVPSRRSVKRSLNEDGEDSAGSDADESTARPRSRLRTEEPAPESPEKSSVGSLDSDKTDDDGDEEGGDGSGNGSGNGNEGESCANWGGAVQPPPEPLECLRLHIHHDGGAMNPTIVWGGSTASRSEFSSVFDKNIFAEASAKSGALKTA